VRTPSFLTVTDQVADHLRGEIQRGRWSGTLPGKHQLAAELGVNNKTIEAALRSLEKQRILVPQGQGKARRIAAALPDAAAASLRVAFLLSEAADAQLHYLVEAQHLLLESGHTVIFPERTLHDLKHDPVRIARLVSKTQAQAWVIAGGSHDVLAWFAAQPVPAFALFGRREGLPIAAVGPDKTIAFAQIVGRLVALGHRRIVLIERRACRSGRHGRTQRAFLEALRSHGIATGSYNLPDWEDTIEGFHRLLDELFRLTPPTALILDEAFVFHAAQQHLARQGIRAPEHVSLICTDPDPTFAWCVPSIAHIRWDSRPVTQRIVRWTENIARGKDDRRQSHTPARFVEGGTVGGERNPRNVG
jgi:DNA-binding LacI/PurR family transcriptional regulator/DNA-binding transcriptional regulator YhcF (GntR family)